MTPPQRFPLTVNGHAVEVAAREDTPLLYVLRNELGLKGTRFGCGEGLCGACTVDIDGVASFSCDTPTWSVAGKAVRTVEGLGSEASLHPLQTAILEEQAGQCGYCLSGILMRIAVLLEHTPDASDAQVREALARNLCRCGAHQRILKAIARVRSLNPEGAT
jgi:nicotinate dehydrogenase subunit A